MTKKKQAKTQSGKDSVDRILAQYKFKHQDFHWVQWATVMGRRNNTAGGSCGTQN